MTVVSQDFTPVGNTGRPGGAGYDGKNGLAAFFQGQPGFERHQNQVLAPWGRNIAPSHLLWHQKDEVQPSRFRRGRWVPSRTSTLPTSPLPGPFYTARGPGFKRFHLKFGCLTDMPKKKTAGEYVRRFQGEISSRWKKKIKKKSKKPKKPQPSKDNSS